MELAEEQQQNNKRTTDLTTRPLLGKIILFALPLMLTSLLQLLYNAADLIVVGQWTGDTAMAAVGSTGALINLIVNLFIGLSVGALSVTARYIGAKKDGKVSRTVHTAISISVLSGFIVGVIGFFISKQILKWMNTPGDILSQSALYLKIYFCGMPVNLLYNFGASILRASGDTRRPLLILGTAGLLNVGLNILTVAGLRMGVAGVGIATVASQAVSAVGVVAFLSKKKDATRFSFKKLRIHRAELFEILRMGIPAGVQGICFSISNVIIQSSINGFGEAAVAGNASAGNLEGFVYVSMNAVAQACLTVVGQNYGAAKTKNIDLTLMQCLLLAAGIGLAVGSIVLAAGKPLLRFYGCTEDGIRYGVQRMRFICIWYFLCGMMDVFAGAMQGMGRSLMPMLVTLFGACVFRVIWVFTVFRWRPTFFILMLSYPVSWLLTLTIHSICLIALRRKIYARLAAAQGPAAGETAPEITPDAEPAPQTGEAASQTAPMQSGAVEETEPVSISETEGEKHDLN